MNKTIHIVYDTIELVYKDHISKSLACRNLSTVISNTITIASKTMITLEKPVVKHLPAELDGVDLHVSTCKYIQIGGTCAPVVFVSHLL